MFQVHLTNTSCTGGKSNNKSGGCPIIMASEQEKSDKLHGPPPSVSMLQFPNTQSWPSSPPTLASSGILSSSVCRYMMMIPHFVLPANLFSELSTHLSNCQSSLHLGAHHQRVQNGIVSHPLSLVLPLLSMSGNSIICLHLLRNKNVRDTLTPPCFTSHSHSISKVCRFHI